LAAEASPIKRISEPPGSRVEAKKPEVKSEISRGSIINSMIHHLT
jgi:hypothetical protein